MDGDGEPMPLLGGLIRFSFWRLRSNGAFISRRLPNETR